MQLKLSFKFVVLNLDIKFDTSGYSYMFDFDVRAGFYGSYSEYAIS